MGQINSGLFGENETAWSKYPIEITTPKHKYQGNSNKPGDESPNRVAAPLPRAFYSYSMVPGSAGEMIVFGGVTGYLQLLNDTWIIRFLDDSDSALGSSRTPARMRVTASLVETTGTAPSPRYQHRSALVDRQLVVWGGTTSIDAEGNPMPPADSLVYALDLDTKSWSTLTIQPSPSARSAFGACTIKQRLIVFGGFDGARNRLNDLWSLDLSSLVQGLHQWEYIKPASGSRLPQGRAHSSVVAYQEKLYVFGGWDKRTKTYYNDTWCFDMTTRVWTELRCTGSIPAARYGHAVSLVGDTTYMFGGDEYDDTALADMWGYKIPEQKWYKIPDIELQPLRSRGHSMVTVKDTVLVLGGVAHGFRSYAGKKMVHIIDTSMLQYPEDGEEVTLSLKQPLSATSTSRTTFDLQRFRPETPSSQSSDLLTDIHPRRSITLGKGTEGDSPSFSPHKAVYRTRDTITGAMSATEILRYLVDHGCSDLSQNTAILHVSEHPISTGGFGDVYRATLQDGKKVALKCVRVVVGSTAEGRSFLKRAAWELYVWSKCKHHNVLELLGMILFRDQLAMVSPWVEHGHLRWYLSQHPQADRYGLCIDIASGIEYMHKSGIVHGDLKPENILVSDNHVPKLTDFGNSVMAECTLHFSQSDSGPNMSMRWTAPEILSEETRTTRAGDIYAFGMIIFEVTTGILPYAGLKEPVIMRRILTGKVPNRPEEHLPNGVEQADRLWSLITRCWSFEPRERPDAREVKSWMKGISPEWQLANWSSKATSQ